MAATITGTVRYGDGSKAAKKKVTFDGASGQATCFTDGSGNYRIDIASGVARAAYVDGRKIWSGSCTGGRLDLKAG